jgi:hypothetical protein
MAWPAFWATFQQTHLATLVLSKEEFERQRASDKKNQRRIGSRVPKVRLSE